MTSPSSSPVATKRSLPRRIGRLVWKISSRLVLLLVLLVSIAIAVAHTSWGENKIRGFVEAQLQKQLNTSAKVGGLSFSLTSGIELRQVTIEGNDGQPAITIERILLEPKLTSLLGSTPTLKKLAVSGVHLDVRSKVDGTTNLTGIGKSQPKNQKPPKPFAISLLDVSDVNATLINAEGGRTVITGLTIKGQLAGAPATQSGNLSATLAIAGIDVKAPGRNVIASNLSSSIELTAVDGTVTAVLGATNGDLQLLRDELPIYPTKLVLGSATVAFTPAVPGGKPGTIDLSAGPIQLSAITIESTEFHGEYQGLDLVGEQHASLNNLVVSAIAVNELAQRDVLAGDLALNLVVDGPPRDLVLSGSLVTPGGILTLAGSGSVLPPFEYQATLTAPSFEPKKVIAGNNGPPLTLGVLAINVSGGGPDVTKLEHKFDLSLTGTTVAGVDVDKVAIAGTFVDDVLRVPTIEIVSGNQSIRSTLRFDVAEKDGEAHIVARITTAASISDTVTALRGAGVEIPPSPALSRLELDGPMTLTIEGDPAGTLQVRAENVALRLRGGGKIRGGGGATLTKGDVTVGEPAFKIASMDGELRLSGVSLQALARLAPKKRGAAPPPAGKLNGQLQFSGTPEAPNATFSVKVALDHDVADVSLHGSLRGKQLSAHADLQHQSGVSAVLDLRGGPSRGGMNLALRGEVRDRTSGPIRATIVADAKLRGSIARAATAPISWTAKIDASKTMLAELPLPQATLDALLPSAAGSFSLTASGTRHNLAADLALALTDVKDAPDAGIGPIDVALGAHLDKDGTTAQVTASADGNLLVDARVRAELRGTGLLDKLKANKPLDPELEINIQIPERELAPLIRNPLAKGTIGGAIQVVGRPSSPHVLATFSADQLIALDGTPASAVLAIDGTRANASATITLADALSIAISASPAAAMAALSKPSGAVVPVEVAVTTKNTPLVRLLPDIGALRGYRAGVGRLSSDLSASLGLLVKDGKATIDTVSMRGALSIEGASVVVPMSSRKYEDIGLSIVGDESVLRLANLEVHERDLDKPDRNVKITGDFNVLSRQATLSIAAADMLVFGGANGKPDAPRAAISTQIDVAADLSSAIAQVNVTVNSLELINPDRYPLTHQAEELSRGDIIELGGDLEVGKLKRTHAGPPTTPPVDTTGLTKTLDVRVHIPDPVHVYNSPLTVDASGEIHIEKFSAGFGPVIKTEGALVGSSGKLFISGTDFGFDSGQIILGGPLPQLALNFAEPPSNAALRDFATDYGSKTYVHLNGPVGFQKLTMSGTGDVLFDGLSLTSIGRVRVLGRPDAVASVTAQLPTLREIQISGFVKGNLPHLYFLDRVNTYADPNVSRFAYGRFQNLAAERYLGRRRLLITERPLVVGQSQGELELSHLWLNTKQAISGVGVVAGTRVGGGLAVFWEWSSAD